ncbi:MAG TPA: hypothetical protein PKW80_14630 [Bacteroidales bacterium]|nr:hypothetical protein [Bacteroidales bacterium]
MPETFKNKYRRTSHRKPGWDYSSDGMYYITLVTQDRICNLGKIINTSCNACMQLSKFGQIVDAEWHKSFEIRKELFLDEYIIMPNHLHAIVVIDKNDKTMADTVGAEIVGAHGRAPLQFPPYLPLHPFVPLHPFYRLPKSISSFLAGFKSAVNSKIDDYIDANHLNIPKYNRHNHFFQPNYYDHIIRDEQSYQRISEYIKNNPAKWQDDKFF